MCSNKKALFRKQRCPDLLYFLHVSVFKLNTWRSFVYTTTLELWKLWPIAQQIPTMEWVRLKKYRGLRCQPPCACVKIRVFLNSEVWVPHFPCPSTALEPDPKPREANNSLSHSPVEEMQRHLAPLLRAYNYVRSTYVYRLITLG